MNRTSRVFMMALAAVAACVAGEGVRRVEGKGEEQKKKEPISAATKYAPEGNIRTPVKVNEQFKKAAGGKDGNEKKTSGTGDGKKAEVKKDLSKKGVLTDAFNGKKTGTPPKGKEGAATSTTQTNRPKPKPPTP